MLIRLTSSFRPQRLRWLMLGLAFMIVAGSFAAPMAMAQGKNDNAKLKEADAKADAALKAVDENAAAATPAPVTVAPPTKGPDLFGLWFQGGPLMYPITGISFLVVMLAVERWLGLRRGRTVPRGLVDSLKQLGKSGNFDPRQAYQLCQQHPSVLANVTKTVLLKVGRPLSELELTFKEACERESGRLYKNVRTINLAVTITPLIGLLGTVQGMIECFYTTANLGVGMDKSQALANGIYVALLTTFGGLVVAIPAAIVSHYFEGKIQARFLDIEELFVSLLPQLERYEGKVRMARQTGSGEHLTQTQSMPQPTGTGA
jgi:biopolymer transport protein ExbB